MGIVHIHSLLSQRKGFVNESYVGGESIYKRGNQKFIASKLTHIRTYDYGFSLLLTQKLSLWANFCVFPGHTPSDTTSALTRLYYEGTSLLQLLLLLYPGAAEPLFCGLHNFQGSNRSRVLCTTMV